MYSKRHFLALGVLAFVLNSCIEGVVTSTLDVVPDHSVQGYIRLATGDTILIDETSISHQITIDSNETRDTVHAYRSDHKRLEVVAELPSEGEAFVCPQFLATLVGSYREYGAGRIGLNVTSHQLVYSDYVVLDRYWRLGESYSDSTIDSYYGKSTISSVLMEKDVEVIVQGQTKRVDVFRRSYGSRVNGDTTTSMLYVEPDNMVVLVEQHTEPKDWSKLPYKQGTVKDTRYELTIKRLRID